MNAEELTRALGGKWHGSYGTARCPAHQDKTPSLSIREGDGGRLLTFCHARCSAEAVWGALVDRGLVEQREDRPRDRRRRRRPQRQDRPISEPSPKQDYALEILRASREPIGTLTATYLRAGPGNRGGHRDRLECHAAF